MALTTGTAPATVQSCHFLLDSGLNMRHLLSIVEERSSVLLMWKAGIVTGGQGGGELNISASF